MKASRCAVAALLVFAVFMAFAACETHEIDEEEAYRRMAVDGRALPAESLDPEMLENAFDIDNAVNIPELTMEAIRSVEIEEIDGNTVMHIVLDGQTRTDFVLENIGNMFEEDTIVRGLSAEVDDILMTVVTDEAGNPVSSVEEIHAQIVHVGGGSLTLDMSYEMVFRAFGDDVEIETKVVLPREVATKEFSNDLNSLTFYLNGTLHTLPVSFAELEEMGWEAPDFTVGPHARRGNVEITNGSQILVVHFSNFTDDRLAVSEAYVHGFFVPRDSEAQVIFPGNIARGSAYEEVIAMHGEPNTREEDTGNQTVLLRYRMDTGSVFLRVDMRTNVVISMNMSN